MSDERPEMDAVDAEFGDEEDREIAELKRQLASTDSELQQSKELQKTLEGAASGTGAVDGAETSSPASGAPAAEGDDAEAREEVDGRSVYVGNVDYLATPEEIQQHFQACGAINRITILCDKFTGHPKGYAYVEFAESSSVTNAMVLNESLFRGRQLSVTAKRTNRPAWQRGGRGRGRGGYRGGYQGRGGYAPYRARGRGRGRGF
ncbi:hypothetical protein FFLO_07009 [Filobasidium floriforme]|uniref:RRM domain-containing protein n=1 Tax=Filobasidium floriforme TaxID=5210 RepID=A0A8K0NMA7_9TREE|nr:uncharacterized protein HD553DRAFT_306141 [Filobasidium floriforme]KAG7527364.1 hypothetical protein FFLO_07009 [Filobasidium floriforme]KAH8088333.1 hypothetical protein HD553DRAFT_306141 [Filobasidium floriforme]